MFKDTDNSADTLDIRDLIERIEELRSERDNHNEDEESILWSHVYEDEAEELAALESFVEEMKGYGGDHQWEGDWYPVTLIRESYWRDYVQEFAEDIGAIKPDMGWPYNHIDWSAAADELLMDYGQADYDGVTYYYR